MSADSEPSIAVAPSPKSLAALGGLLGDPVRAAILLHLSDGSQRPAGELAWLAGASPQAATAHLARLVDGGLLAVEKQGRHRFFRLASGEVAEMLEGLANWIDQPRRAVPRDVALRRARLCYDHLAGELGVAVLDRMNARGLIAIDANGPKLSQDGQAWCACHGLEPPVAGASRRPAVRLCLDWTERRHHLGGQLGAGITAMMLAKGMVRSGQKPRTIEVTETGARFLRQALDLDLKR